MAESRFYSQARLFYKGTDSLVTVPWFNQLPVADSASTQIVVLSDDTGAANQGLYYLANQWRWLMPQVDVSLAVNFGQNIQVYNNVDAPISLAPGSIAYRNGIRVTVTQIPAGESNVFWCVRTAQSGGGGGGDVSSVNSVLPDSGGNVQLTAEDIGAASIADLDDGVLV